MLQGVPWRRRRGKWRIWLMLGLALACICGCQTAQFYRQAIEGECHILAHRQHIEKLIAQPDTDPTLKAKFELVLELRRFAQTNLVLPINKHYLTYTDLHRRFAVWNVHAAPEFSLEPKKWWYPLVGSLKYRGYFAENDALTYARRLAKKWPDVYVEGVEAYSTLGWFADPLLNTFIRHSDADLAEIIFHELAHQRLFLNGDTDFNEAFATAVSEDGVRRWLGTRHDPDTLQHYQTELHRNRQFVALVLAARRELQGLYGEPEDGSKRDRPKPVLDPAWAREQKAQIISNLRAEYQKLKVSWGGYSGYDRWFAESLNNAQLNTVAVYYDLVPGFEGLLRESGGDSERFYKTVLELKKLTKEKRHKRLQEIAGAH